MIGPQLIKIFIFEYCSKRMEYSHNEILHFLIFFQFFY